MPDSARRRPLFCLGCCLDELKQYDFEIISTNLPEEQENQLREAFAQE
jgi:uncharacterized membrane protein